MSKHWSPAKNALRSEMGSEEMGKLDASTLALASRLEARDGAWEPLVQPIYTTSTYRHRSVQSYLDNVLQEGYIYQRLSNPTTEAAEVVVAELEGGAGALLYASGLDAINAVFLTFLSAKDHLVIQRPCYSGTAEFVRDVLIKFGVEVSWVRAGAGESEWRAAMRENTRMLYGETPSNPTMTLLDLEMFGRLGVPEKILTAVDATFASPYAIQPIRYQIDFAIHSCTKYMGGHSDLIAGSVSVRTDEQWKALKSHVSSSGGALDPFHSALLHRGLKTLPLRMQRHSHVATQVAQFLQSHAKVRRVLYPGLESHPEHELAKRQMRVFGGMMALEMGSTEEACRLAEGLKLHSLAVSLGGCESLLTVPAATTHGPMLMSDDDRRHNLITPGLIRYSTGLEDPQDLIRDLSQALDNV